MKRRILSAFSLTALVLVLLLSAWPLALAEDEPVTVETEPATVEEPVAVTLEMAVSVDGVTVKVAAEDGSVPVGLTVRFLVDGRLQDTALFTGTEVTIAYAMQKDDTLYRVETEEYSLEDRLYQPAEAEQTVDFTQYGFDVDFFACEDLDFNTATGDYSFKWNYDSEENTAGADIDALLLNNRSVAFSGEKGELSANLFTEPNGVYTVSVRLKAGDLKALVTLGEVELLRDIQPQIRVVADGESVTATVTDPWGNFLEGLSVLLRINGIAYAPVETNEGGLAAFNIAINDGDTVECVTDETQCEGYRLMPASGKLGEEPGTTTTTSRTYAKTTRRTTTPHTYTEETLPTGNTIPAARTTSVALDSRIALSVGYEEVIENDLDVTREAMAQYACVYMLAEDYDLYLTDTTSCLIGFVRSSAYQPSDKKVATAMNKAKIRGFGAEDAYRASLELSLICIDNETGTEMMMPVLDADYIISLPLPATLMAADAVAVAFCDGQSGELEDMTMATVEEGYLRFPAKTLGSMVIVGLFAGTTDNNLFLPIFLIVLGGLLILGGGGYLALWITAYVSNRKRRAAHTAHTVSKPTATTAPAPSEAPEKAPEKVPEKVPPLPDDFEYEDIYSSESKRPKK